MIIFTSLRGVFWYRCVHTWGGGWGWHRKRGLVILTSYPFWCFLNASVNMGLKCLITVRMEFIPLVLTANTHAGSLITRCGWCSLHLYFKMRLMFIITLAISFEIVFCIISSNKCLSSEGEFYFWKWLQFNCELRFEKKLNAVQEYTSLWFP